MTEVLEIREGDVHVWSAALDLSAPQLERLQATLSPDELERAGRFHFPRDRNRFMAARGLLRVILGLYLGRDPVRIRFHYSVNGKPSLAGGSDPSDLRFNLSHTQEIALYAITRGREIGVDIEWMRHEFADLDIAERFFSEREVAALRALPASQQQEAFFHCWTRKEAFLKAKGDGLSLPLDQFDVSLSPGEPAVLLSTRWDAAEASRWTLHALAPAPGYAAALAVEGRCRHVELRQWPVYDG